MSEEIKEILDKFDKVLENYELDKKFGQMSVDSICHLFPSKMISIKDYITNLQEELKSANESITWWTNRFKTKEKENKELKERCEYLQRSCDRKEEQRDDARMEYMEQEDYKLRNEKAIKFLKENACYEEDTKYFHRDLELDDCDELLNILTGGDKE